MFIMINMSTQAGSSHGMSTNRPAGRQCTAAEVGACRELKGSLNHHPLGEGGAVGWHQTGHAASQAVGRPEQAERKAAR